MSEPTDPPSDEDAPTLPAEKPTGRPRARAAKVEADSPGISPTEAAGDTIGPYTLIEPLGEGGFGRVWLASQVEPVEREVALKILNRGQTSPEILTRFELERQALAVMDHPHIARVFDAGATESGTPYFVMEVVRGHSLTTYCEERKLSVEDRIRLFIPVCQAVQHAHAKGIVHRDLKPSNVLVTEHDGKPVPKVIDFGIAKAVEDQPREAEAGLTLEGQLIGTPQYMSPEQVTGRTDVDTRTDVYSLGVLLYELLVGTTPVDPTELRAAGWAEMERLICEQDFPRPSQRVRTIDPEVTTTCGLPPTRLTKCLRGDLDWIAMRALEKNRERRYETPSELALDLDRHLNQEPVLAGPPSASYRFGKFLKKRKGPVAAAAAIFLVLVAGLAGSLLQAKRAERAERIALEEKEQAEAISQYLVEIFQRSNPEEDGRTLTVVEALNDAGRRLETELSDHPIQRARLHGAIGQTYNGLGIHSEAARHYQQSYDLLSEHLGEDHKETQSAMGGLCDAYRFEGNISATLPLIRKLHQYSLEEHGRYHPRTTHYLFLVARATSELGVEDTIDSRGQALDLYDRFRDSEDINLLFTIARLNEVFDDPECRDAAQSLLLRALEISESVPGGPHQATLEALADLNEHFRRRAQSAAEGTEQHQEFLDRSLEFGREALAVSRTLHGDESPETIRRLTALVTSNQLTRDETIALCEELSRLCTTVLGPAHPQTRASHGVLSLQYLLSGDLSRSLELAMENYWAALAELGGDHPMTQEALQLAVQNIGVLQSSDPSAVLGDGHLEIARAYRSQAQRLHGTKSSEHADSLGVLAYLHEGRGEWGPLYRVLEQKYEILKEIEGPLSFETLDTGVLLADAYAKDGRRSDALSTLEELHQLHLEKGGEPSEGALEVHQEITRLLIQMEQFDEALSRQRDHLRTCREAFGEGSSEVFNSQFEQMLLYQATGNLPSAIETGESAIEALRSLDTAGSFRAGEAILALVQMYRETDQMEKGEKVLEEFRSLLADSTEEPRGPGAASAATAPTESQVPSQGGLTENSKNSPTRAPSEQPSRPSKKPLDLEQMESNLARLRSELGPDHDRTLEAIYELANAYAGSGRDYDAMLLREEEAKLKSGKLGPRSVEALRAKYRLAKAYNSNDRHEEALAIWKELEPVYKATFPPDYNSTHALMHALAYSYSMTGRDKEAIKQVDRAYSTRIEVFGPTHGQTLVSMAYQGYLRQRAGKFLESIPYFMNYIRLAQESGNETSYYVYQKGRLGISLLELDRLEEAEKWLLEGYEGLVDSKPDGDRNPRLRYIAHKLSELYTKKGDEEESKRWKIKVREDVQLESPAAP